MTTWLGLTVYCIYPVMLKIPNQLQSLTEKSKSNCHSNSFFMCPLTHLHFTGTISYHWFYMHQGDCYLHIRRIKQKLICIPLSSSKCRVIMVFNATFNNISFISSGSVLLVKETGRRKPPTCCNSLTNFIT